jgi:acyl dehydratase
MRVFSDVSDLPEAVGEDLGTSDWAVIDQARIDAFADATGDHQWIHVDGERAAAGPFGGTIAHGLLTLSLLPQFLHQIYRVDNVAMVVNYALNKVRFPALVPAGTRLRASSRMAEATTVGRGVPVVLVTTIESVGGHKPACVVESIVRYLA